MPRRRPTRSLPASALALTLAVTALGACSDDGGDAAVGTTTSTAAASTSSTAPRPAGPAADVSEEITGTAPPFIGTADRTLADGYVEREFVARGTATSYEAEGPLREYGKWRLEPGASAEYRTRILVRAPEDDADFSGTVLVEWLNVSGGVDAGPDWDSAHEEIERSGDVWIGVSAQRIGVMGGPVLVEVASSEGIAGKGLVAIDPQRYGSLEHPGDGFAYDIFTQVARAAREGGEVLGGPDRAAEHVIALGESQSAIALVSYFNGVQPLTRAFDGFLIHSRGSSALPIDAGEGYADLAGSIGRSRALLRTDLDAPVLMLQTESDLTGVLDSASARQDDTERFRLWEVAGTGHADAHLLGPTVDDIDCGVPVNNGPMHVVTKAALHHLKQWVATGEAPPTAERIELTPGAEPDVARDADGIALGGVRTPPVDVPVEVLSGVPGPNPEVICILLGSTTPLPPDRIGDRYDDADDYEQQYDAAVEDAIAAGFVLADDTEAIRAFAQPDLVTTAVEG